MHETRIANDLSYSLWFNSCNDTNFDQFNFISMLQQSSRDIFDTILEAELDALPPETAAAAGVVQPPA